MLMADIPPCLNKGDKIGVFAPSSHVDKEDIEKSKAILEKLGFEVFVHPQTYERENQSAGNHLQKSLAFQGLWQRDDIKAIWAAGGGNRCTHLLETINFGRLKNSAPKILIGFSDVTSLLNAVYAHTNITTFHGQVFKNIHKYKQLDHLLKLLGGDIASYRVNKGNIIKSGSAKGKLVGGNLSIFQYMPQTLPNDFYKGGILFLEDCNEELSRIDRMFLHLRRIGVLGEINALALGQFTNMQESGRAFGYSLHDIISEHTQGLDIPVLYDLPFGHGDDFYSMPIGVNAEINTDICKFTLLEAASYKP